MRSATPTAAAPGRAGFPPGPRLPAPLQAIDWLRGSTSVLRRCHRRYGDMFTVNLVAKVAAGPAADAEHGRWVFLAHPDHVKQLLTADPSAVRTGETNRFLEPLVGPRSILVLDGQEHRAQRRLMLPPLHGDHIAGYGELMSEVAEAELRRWPVGEPFGLWPSMQAITLEIIVRAVFGVRDPDRVRHVTGVLRTLLNRMTSPAWLAAHAALATVAGSSPAGFSRAGRRLIDPVDDVINDEIARRRVAPDLEDRTDILSLLVRARYKDGSAMTDRELRDELMTLLIAGHESTATALAWAFERLLRHPDALERARAEADTGGEDYAGAVAKEALRLRPVLPFVLRALGRPMEIGGHALPAGAWLAPCAYLIHRRPDVYPEPLRFRPERFLERPEGAYTWMPFGGGVRRCLGASFAQLEMRRVLRAVLRHADLEPADPEAERISARFITLAPARGARVVLRGRR
ncbi:cytochrome P450 [Pseudonocardia acaciae]|uniref:cytochrome P450 n=1 Tax=Pseudonocardia acaciae TaxID=551276 RepID=UPI00068754B2|nr:cytochrome P450 [Pseudonocardia acaciae]